MEKIIIRTAAPNDAHAIALVHIASWQKAYRGILPDNILDELSVKKRESQWLELINRNINILVLETNQSLVGFVSLGPTRDPDADPTLCGEIAAMYLHPKIWHQGFGKKLLAKALLELQKQGFKEVTLWVFKENTPAQQFYESMGFIKTTKEKMDAYANNISLPAIRYQKNLS